MNWVDSYQESVSRLKEELGCSPKLSLIEKLYAFPFTHGELIEDEEEHNLYWIYVDDVKVRFLEEHHALVVTVEGVLPDAMINQMQQSLLERLSALENTPCAVEVY